jgi:hypothetical protein
LLKYDFEESCFLVLKWGTNVKNISLVRFSGETGKFFGGRRQFKNWLFPKNGNNM